jgi:hypothetical protein
MKARWAMGLAAFGLAAIIFLPRAYASSNLAAGRFDESDPASQSFNDTGICRLFTGPRGNLPAGQFLMTLGDHNSSDYTELQVTGKVNSGLLGATEGQNLRLVPDDSLAVQFFENSLQSQLGSSAVGLTLHSLTAQVSQNRLPGHVDEFDCNVSLTGRLTGDTMGTFPVSVAFRGLGQYFPAAETPLQSPRPRAAALAAAADPSCPAASLAPAGLAPLSGAQCSTPNCLINFKGYQWWTSYDYFGPPFPQNSYFWNANNQWSPKNAFVDSAGLHLLIQTQDTGGGPKPSAAEVVAMFKADGSQANLGYGDYLVVAQVKSAASWDKLDPNAAFGAFTYERLGTSGTGTGNTNNPYRELDLAEISHWGYAGPTLPPSPPNPLPPSCVTPSGNPLLDPRLCTGNSQFTLQLWDDASDNLHRYSINPGVNTVTLVMQWHGANQPVSFAQYDGAWNFENLSQATPSNQWTTSAADNPFIPATSCERFHLNFWQGNFPDVANGFNPPPATIPQEVVVTDFEFQPFP